MVSAWSRALPLAEARATRAATDYATTHDGPVAHSPASYPLADAPPARTIGAALGDIVGLGNSSVFSILSDRIAHAHGGSAGRCLAVRVLVTGGAGFVGSHLIDLLLRAGHDVTALDDFSSGRPTNLSHIRSRRFRVVRGNASRAPFARYDRIYHLASPASPDDYGRRPIATLLTNADGTRRILEVARRAGARFLLASTSEVYGDPLEHPQQETYWGNVNPVGPRSSYDEGKRFAEALTVAYVEQYGVDARIVRIFNSYGPRMRADDGRMPSAFIVSAIAAEPIRVHGDGSQTRSLCYVEDTARGLIAAMQRGRPGDVYNIGRPDELSVLEFARRVRHAAGSRSRIVFVPGRPQDIRRRRPDIRKAIGELRWRPRTTLDEGLRRTVAWYRRGITGERGG